MPAAYRIATAPPRFRAPAGYTPPHLAKRILASLAALAGERKQITVLFADIKSSLELLVDRDPEEARALLDPVLQIMLDAVHAFDGMVNQVMGDGIMALFGAPIALEDHALRAGLAALRMLERVEDRNTAVGAAQSAVQLRIGLHSGEVLVRSIGSDLDLDYSAIGRTTHVAARLEQMARPGTALASGAVLRRAEGFLRTRALATVPVRGLHDPLEVGELVGVDQTRMRFQAAAARGLTPLVGRQRELGEIGRALHAVAEGRGQVVALVGEAGIGKSRLVWETARSAPLDGWLVMHGGAVSYGVGAPYLPFRHLLQAYFEIGSDESAKRAAARVRARLETLGVDIAAVAMPILALLDLPTDRRAWGKLEPPQRRQQTEEAVWRLLQRESEQRPVLLVVEDLHWTDRETEALLAMLAARVASRPIALLLDARPEYERLGGPQAPLLQLLLGPLDAAQQQAMLQALLGPEPGLDELAATIGQRTGGNPFFIEECVRGLVEAGVLTGKAGRYQLARRAVLTAVPDSVQGMIAARIDRLLPDDKALLQCASAIGPTVALPILAELRREKPSALEAGLSRLQAANFLYESRRLPEPELAFVHALTCEVAYAGLLHEQQRSLHERIFRAIEVRRRGRLDEHADALARHALRGQVWERAAHWSRQAAATCASRSAYHEARAYLEQALHAAAQLPESASNLACQIDLRLELRSVLFPLREITVDLENLQLAETLANQLADSGRLARLLTMQTRDLSILGRAGAAVECGRRAVALAAQVGDAELQVLADAYLGSVCVARGEYREAVAILRRAGRAFRGRRALARFGLPGPAAVFCRVWLVTALTRLGDFAQARREVASSLRAAAKADQPLARLVARYTEGYLLAHCAQWAEAASVLEDSLALCRDWRLPAWFSNIASVLGWVYANSGRQADGEQLMRDAIDASARGGGMVNHSAEVVRLAESLLDQGRAREARESAERAVELAQRHDERGNEAIALRVLGLVLHRLDPSDPLAAEYLATAAGIADELGMRPLASLLGRPPRAPPAAMP